MIFSSYQFLLLFLPTCLTGYFLLGLLPSSAPARWWLVVSSLVFFAVGTGWFVATFLVVAAINYALGTALGHLKSQALWLRRSVLAAGIVGDVVFLGYFKYADFLISNFNLFVGSHFSLLHIVLPLGISFIVFQKIAYLVDSYRGETAGYKFLDYLLFITFFPQLIVGPIVHHRDVVPQFQERNLPRPCWDNLAFGLLIFTLGMAKKLFLADPLTTMAASALAHPDGLRFIETWFYSISYAISYYFDLSGYADMAIGLGRMFNIVLPENFNNPYHAKDFADYWRRWHMTLSRFLGDYIFRPLFHRGLPTWRFYFAIFVTFLVSGFWHGAGWNFVLWGILNGVFVMMAHYSSRAGWCLPSWLAWALTFAGVVLLRAIFVAADLDQARTILGIMLVPSWKAGIAFVIDHPTQIGVFAVGAVFVWLVPLTRSWMEKIPRNGLTALGALVVWAGAFLTMNKVAPFLYFQF